MNRIPWTKNLYNAFVDNAILTDLEKKVLYARVWEKDKWTITGLAMENHVGKTTINNCISSIRSKYMILHNEMPSTFPRMISGQKEDKD